MAFPSDGTAVPPTQVRPSGIIKPLAELLLCGSRPLRVAARSALFMPSLQVGKTEAEWLGGWAWGWGSEASVHQCSTSCTGISSTFPSFPEALMSGWLQGIMTVREGCVVGRLGRLPAGLALGCLWWGEWAQPSAPPPACLWLAAPPLRRIAPPWASVSPLCLRGLVRWSPGSLAAVARRTLEWPRQCLHGAGGQGSRGVGPGPVAKQVLPVWGRLRALVFSPPGPGCRDAPAGRGQ